MKLLERNNRIFFRFTALLLLGGSVLFYLAVNFIIRAEQDELLAVNTQRAIGLLQQGQSLPQFAPMLEVEQLTSGATSAAVYGDTVIYDSVEGEDEPFRQLISITEINGSFYRITNRTSLVETEDLLFGIGICTVVLALLLLLGLYQLNRRSARNLWKPFQQQLHALSQFSLAREEGPILETGDIEEFEILKKSLLDLTEKLRTDYRNLKEFTENASHEIQTPLAIIRSKIEYLIEDEAVSEPQMAALATIYEASNRLSRLNKGLLLLAKIENRQFGDEILISFNTLIQEQVELLDELMEAKELHIQFEALEEVTATANSVLVSILLKNLLENAIRYSEAGSLILIQSSSRKIVFSNPGEREITHAERLFERFHKESQHQASLGLGLAMVRKICEAYHWQIDYRFREGRHEFCLSI